MGPFVLVLALLTVAEGTGGEGSLPAVLQVRPVGPIGPTFLRVDLVIVGDGYVKEDFQSKGKWEIDSARLVVNFFEKIPFKNLRHLFNVHLVDVVSKERGADDSPHEDTRRTAFNSTFGFNGIDRLLVAQDEEAILHAARKAPAADIILILVNDPREGGSGGRNSDIPTSVCSTESTAFLAAIHELGHSFAGLGDEYADKGVQENYPLPETGDLDYPNLTLAPLVDTSSREKLVRTLKWGRFFKTASSFKELGKGYYEGGYYREKGIYRPAISCAMQTESGGGRFCYVCLDEMSRAIYQCAGRGPTGGLSMVDGPEMETEGKMGAAYELYVEGKLSRSLLELKKVEEAKNSSPADRKNAEALKKGMEDSLSAALKRIDDLLVRRDAKGAKEYFSLLDAAFKGTEWAGLVNSKKKELAKGQD